MKVYIHKKLLENKNVSILLSRFITASINVFNTAWSDNKMPNLNSSSPVTFILKFPLTYEILQPSTQDQKSGSVTEITNRVYINSNLLNMRLHLKWCIELLVAVFTLCKVTEVKVDLSLRIYVTLDVHHGCHIVVQHLVTIPALIK